MKKIFIDEKLKKYIVPQELRETSKANGTRFTPGTRIPLNDNVKFLRLFTAWSAKDEQPSSCDLDLSGAFIKETPKGLEVTAIDYTNQSETFAVHSGDFTNAKAVTKDSPEFTAEFIDIDLERTKKAGFKYVITGTFIYGGAKDFSEIITKTGVQLLTELRTSKKQSINLNNSLLSFDISNKFQSMITLAIDVETMEIVILDQFSEEHSGINIHSMAKKMDEYKKLYFNACDFSCTMYELLEMYCEANDFILVEKINDANIICSYDTFENIDDSQIQYNISDNLENIINLLN